jgi:hypothetical protein
MVLLIFKQDDLQRHANVWCGCAGEHKSGTVKDDKNKLGVLGQVQ